MALSFHNDLLRVIVSARDGKEMLQQILDHVMRAVRAERGSVMLWDAACEALVIKSAHGTMPVSDGKTGIQIGEGIAGRAFANKEPIVIADIETDPRIRRPNRPGYRTRSCLSFPLSLHGQMIGVLNLADKEGEQPFGERELDLLAYNSDLLEIGIGWLHLEERLVEQQFQARTDPLTHLANRRCLDERLFAELERGKRHSLPFSLVTLDLDNFKAVNDRYGHLAGDQILKQVAELLQHTIRVMDVAARYGGEEFCLILPQTQKKEAVRTAKRILRNMTMLRTQIQHTDLTITASIGVASYPTDADQATHLLACADLALYQAKRAGKNRIAAFSAKRNASLLPVGA